MALIPGLLRTPVEDVTTSIAVDSKGIELMSFGLTPFTVPEVHRYGKCRLISEFDKISQLGEGAFGTVYKVKDNKNGEILALKKMKIEKGNQCLPLNFIREVTVLKSLHHDNIINMSGIAVGRTFESTYIILEFCQYQLSKVVDDKLAHSFLDLPQIKNIMLQLFTGLNYMHKHFVLHRDLSVNNILFTAAGILKISDFGFARMLPSDEAHGMTPNVVSRWYRAPEILLGARTYTSAIDIWSAGCIFAELLLKKPLFQADTDNNMIALIVSLLGTPTEDIWPGLSALPVMQNYELCSQPYNRLRSHFEGQPSTCISLIHKLFLYNPKTRYDAEQCLAHSYFTEDNPSACDLGALLILLRKPDEI